MKFNHFSRSLLVTAGLLFAAAGSALAQRANKDAKIGDPEIETIPSPDISSGVSKKFKPKDWVSIEVSLEYSPREEPESGYIDDVVVRWFVLANNPSRNVKYLRLSETVQHMNMPVGEEIFSSVYLSPATLRKITGKNGANASDIVAAACEIIIDGVPVGTASTRFSVKDWWKVSSAQVASNDNFKLLTKADTPFAPLWWDRYLEIRPKR